MAAIRIYRRLQDLRDVDPNGLPDGGIPQYDTFVSSFVVDTLAAGGAFSGGVSNLGNTLGDTGVTGTRLVLAGVGRVTLSQSTDANGGTITISGGTAGAGAFSGGVSDIGNTDGVTGITGTQVVLAGGNNVTLSQSVDGNGATVTISGPTTVPQSVQTQNLFDLTVDGNTAGVLALVSSGTLTLAGGSNITLSQNGNAISIIGNAAGTETQVAISGLAASNTTYTSGTVTITGVGGGITVSSNTGQRIDLSVAAQSVQPGVQQLVVSNTTFSSGTVSISGFGDVTVNTAANIIRISAPVQTAESQSIGMSNLGNTSGTTGIASGAQVRMLFAGGNNVTLSQSLNGASGTITISAASQTVQTQNVVDVTMSGNTSGAGALVSSGTLTLAGGNNITLSQAGNAITISGPNVGGAQTGISGIANSQTTFTSGTVSLSELGAITIRSTTGNQFQLSVNAQTGTQFSAGISGGNTSGDTGTVGGRLVLAGGNNITLSGSTNGASETITISAGAGGGFSGGVSNVGNSSGDTGITGSRLVFAGGNSITLSQSTNASGGTITVSAPNASVLSAVAPLSTSTNGSTISILGPAQLSVGFSTAGNTAGDTGFVTGRLALVGSNGITLSGSTNAGSQTITISGVTQSVESQSIGMSNLGNTSGTTGIASGGQVRFLLAGGNGVTLSQSLNGASGTLTISVASQTVESQSFGMSNLGNTSGTTGIASGGQVRFLLAGGNNITLSQSINGASGTITISAPNAVAQTNQTLGMYAVQNTTGQSSSTTMDARTLSVAGDGAVSVGYSAGSLRISAPVQTGTQFSGGISGGNTSGDTGTVGGRLVLAGGNNITLSGSTNGASETITISAPTQTVESQSIGMSNIGNTSGTTGVASGGQVRFVFAGGNNITLSQSLNGASGTITISAPNLGAGAMSAGVSNLGNSAGATGITGTQLVLVGSDNITLSQTTGANGGTVSIIGGAGGGFSAGVSTGGNTAGATGVSGTRMVLVGTNAISLSQTTGAAGNTVTIDAPATSSLSAVSGIKLSTNGSTISIGYGASLADWENMPRAQASLMSHVSAFSKTPIYWNDHIDGDLTAKSMAFAISMVTASQPLSVSAHLGVYTLVNSTSAALLGSVSEAYVVSSASSVSLSGVRNMVMTGIGTHTALSNITGGEYMLGMMFSATATNAMNFSLLGASGGAGPLGAIHPGTNQLSTGTTQGIQQMAGRGSATVNAMPANVIAADVINQGTAGSMALHPWIYIRS